MRIPIQQQRQFCAPSGQSAADQRTGSRETSPAGQTTPVGHINSAIPHHSASDQPGSSDLRTQARLKKGREVLQAEITAIELLQSKLDETFSEVVDQLLECNGQIVVTGIGKAGIIGRKFSASLTSTGSPSHFLHPAEAVHGDLGCVSSRDVVVVLSYSGETEEILRLLPTLRSQARCIVAVTASQTSSLGKLSDYVLQIGYHREACTLGLAPSVTTTALLSLCDALTLTVSHERGLTKEQFAKYHPAGNLGRQLMNVCEVMRPLEECRVASEQLTVRQVMVKVSRPGRRTGAVMLVNEAGKLTGIFTDSDLARILERCEDIRLDQPIANLMTRKFHTISQHSRLPEATELMAKLKISELPVVTEDDMPLGIIDLTDLVGMVTAPAPSSQVDNNTETPSYSTSDIDLYGPRIIPFRSANKRNG
ncbi:MAG: KpsF/GutQ family sugar-phosphate isomerase [Pirellulales bacterium]